MPRKLFRKYLPSHDAIRKHRFLSRFAHLSHPNVWHLNRYSVATGVAVGMFSGLLPPPFQMVTAAILAVPLRGNLPVAVITTLYTNPFTFLPLYLLAYWVGQLLVGSNGGFVEPPPFSLSELRSWFGAFFQWMVTLGKPLIVGIVTLGVTFAFVGWAAVHAGWRLHVVLAWRKRCAQRRARAAV